VTSHTIFIFAMSLILLWIKPGPGQALKITTTLNGGLMAGFAVTLGIITGCVIFFLVAVLGTGVLTAYFSQASIFLKILGGAYLIYLSIKGLKNLKKGQWQDSAHTHNQNSKAKTFIQNYPLGLFTNLANPLPIFFFLGLIPTLMPIADMTAADIMTGVAIIIAVGLVVDGLLIVMVDMAKGMLSETKIIKRLNLFTSIGFGLIGLFLIYSAFAHHDFSFSVV